jgi:hypothetical protein
MKSISRVSLAALLAIGVGLFAVGAGAAERLLVPEQMDLPWYVLGLGHTEDFAWLGSVFYRPLETAPGDIAVNDLVYVDSEAYPLRVEGFGVVNEGDFYPLNAVLRNRPGEVVEICFCSAQDTAKALKNDGRVTVKELRTMHSLMVGYADFYLEVNQPLDPGDRGQGFSRDVIAMGELEDGRPFYLRSVFTNGAYNIEFRFAD